MNSLSSLSAPDTVLKQPKSLIQAVSVFCSSYDHINSCYQQAADKLGRCLAKASIRLVFGGGRVGLMGIVANGAMAEQGYVIGYIPDHLDDIEGGHTGISELHIVDSMHTRKQKMFEAADAFIVLPGGFGTLDEIIEILTWRQIRLHTKPVVFVNTNNYWDPLFVLFEKIIAEGFAKTEHSKFYHACATSDEAVAYLVNGTYTT